MRAVALLVSLSALAWGTGSAAQEVRDEDLVAVKGTVIDVVTGQPLPGVLVVVEGADVQAESDDAGQFTLARIPVGAYKLELSRDGYRTSLHQFAVLNSGEFVTSMEPMDHSAEGLLTGIAGVVTDGVDGRPMVGATVWTADPSRWTRTDGRGRFSFTELDPGLHILQFSFLGYVTRADSIRVEYGRLTNARVSLSADPIQLDPIEVSVERREIALQDAGFYERKAMGFGKFVDREDIQKRAGGTLTDLFTGIPGVRFAQDPDTGRRYVMLSGGVGNFQDCFPRVMLDDNMVAPGGDQPAQLDVLLSRSAVAGVEVYTRSAGVPVRYSGLGSSCGVIVIWTRR